MKVLIRADAEREHGSGHVYRCASLAAGLRARGAEVAFVLLHPPGEMTSWLQGNGFRVHRFGEDGEGSGGSGSGPLETDRRLSYDWERDRDFTEEAIRREGGSADWIVVDHYALDRRWESSLRRIARRILVIDDLADRPHDCEVLLDVARRADGAARYRGLVPDGARLLLGPRYSLLREEFHEARSSLRRRDGSVRRLLIFFGGADVPRDTEKSLEAVAVLGWKDLAVDVVVGRTNPRAERIGLLCAEAPNAECHRASERMAALMAAADLALGSGGSASWERCYLGLPSIVVIQAGNQEETVEEQASAGAAWSLGPSKDVDAERIARALARARECPRELVRMGTSAARVAEADSHDRGETLLKLMTGGNDAAL